MLGVARDGDALQPRLAAPDHAHGRPRHAEPSGDQGFKGSIGASGLGHRAHARLQHLLAAMIPETNDLVAAGLWREANRNDNAIAA